MSSLSQHTNLLNQFQETIQRFSANDKFWTILELQQVSEGSWKVFVRSGECLNSVWKVSVRSLESVWKVIGSFVDVVLEVSESTWNST